jgi:hypothetical protein
MALRRSMLPATLVPRMSGLGAGTPRNHCSQEIQQMVNGALMADGQCCARVARAGAGGAYGPPVSVARMPER